MPTQTEPRSASPADAPRSDADPGTRPFSGRVIAWVLPVVLVVCSAMLLLYRIDHPGRLYFDEVYYTEDAAQYLRTGVEEGFAVHPPVGKWVIAGGIAVFGNNPVGWRVPVALAGVLTVLVTYLAGLRLFRRRGVAALAALLLAVDGLWFTMSRIAMLDAILTLFVMTGFWLLLLDRDGLWAGIHPDTDSPAEDRPLPRRPRPFRWLAGVAFGLAVATKWSGVLALGAAGLFLLAGELWFRRRTTGRWLAGWPRLLVGLAITVAVVPATVYVLSYTAWFVNFDHTRLGAEPCPYTVTVCQSRLLRAARSWVGDQVAIARFHFDLDADHPYRSDPRAWLILARPVAHYYEGCTDEQLAAGTCLVEPGNVSHILGMGNPVLWWLALLAYAALAAFGIARRDRVAAAIGVFLALLYVPWLSAARPAFLFYLTPMVPFIALAVAYAAWRAGRPPLLRWIPGMVALVVVAGFLFWYPVFSGMEISREAWELRMLFRGWI